MDRDTLDDGSLDGGASTRFSSVIATRETIAGIIDGLPEPYGPTLRLQVYDDLDYEQIAGRLRVPVGTVRSRLAKARALVAERLDLGQSPAP